MKDLDYQNRKWFADQLVGKKHGTKGKVADAIGMSRDAIARVINFKGKGETRNLSNAELRAAAAFFNSIPPGLAGTGTEVPAPMERRAREILRVPLLDKVAAGKLKQPLSQIAVEDVPLLAFADLGRGDFFALTVDGDSMDRVAPDGATIVVDQSDTALVSGKPYVILDRGQTTFKIWKPNPPRFAPASTNPVHEPLYVKSKDIAEKMVLGRVKRAVVDL